MVHIDIIIIQVLVQVGKRRVVPVNDYNECNLDEKNLLMMTLIMSIAIHKL